MRFLSELKRRRLFLLSMVGAVPASRAVADARPEPPAQQGALPASLPYSGAATSSGSVLEVRNLSKGTDAGPSGIGGYGPTGVGGLSTLTAGGFGVKGVARGDRSAGVLGEGEDGSHGVAGQTDSGVGVRGRSDSGIAVEGISKSNAGVLGRSETEPGVQGHNTKNAHDGVNGFGLNGVRGVTWTAGGGGVVGVFRTGEERTGTTITSSSDQKDGVTRGWLGAEKQGVRGECNLAAGHAIGGLAAGGENTVAVLGVGQNNGFAGFFTGKVTVEGSMVVDKIFGKSGLVAGPGKLFKIDHPLDPADKFLMHASVESDERRNLYDGIVTLDDAGSAWVTLPDWFEALNKDYRYQLTCVGSHAPVYIADEICSNQFRIAGGVPGLKVSWLVTGVRHDVLAKARPFVAEATKSASERGKYLYPEEHGKPEADGIHYHQVAAI